MMDKEAAEQERIRREKEMKKIAEMHCNIINHLK